MISKVKKLFNQSIEILQLRKELEILQEKYLQLEGSVSDIKLDRSLQDHLKELDMYNIGESGLMQGAVLPGTQVKLFAGRNAKEAEEQVNEFLKINPHLDPDIQFFTGPVGIYAAIHYPTGLGLESINS